MVSKLSKYGKVETDKHAVVKENGPAQSLKSDEPVANPQSAFT